jgi:hypothetical protein
LTISPSPAAARKPMLICLACAEARAQHHYDRTGAYGGEDCLRLMTRHAGEDSVGQHVSIAKGYSRASQSFLARHWSSRRRRRRCCKSSQARPAGWNQSSRRCFQTRYESARPNSACSFVAARMRFMRLPRRFRGECELAHTAVAQLGVLLLMGKWAEQRWGDTMQRSFKLASHASRNIAGELSHLGFAAHAAMALIVIVLLALTFCRSGSVLSGDKSLNAH